MNSCPVILAVALALPGAAQAQYEDSSFGIFGVFAANEYGYFKGRMGFNNDQYWAWTENHYRALGAHWTRSNLQLIWDQVEPTIGGGYDWNAMLTDGIVRRVYDPGNAAHWLGVFHEGGGPVPPPGGMPQLRNPLSYPNEYSAFVSAAVERYDGDGVGDADPNVRVKYWQAGNEVFNWLGGGRTAQDYIQFVRMLRAATRQADPESRLVLIAPTDGLAMDTFLTQVIDALAAEHAFDVIDVHHWGAAQTWRMTGVPAYRQRLNSLGLTDVQIWSCEHGTWQGQPTNQPSQTEQDQARSLVKRYVWNLNNGLNKLFWNNLMEWYQFNGQSGSIFNSMGLVTDGQGPGEDPTRFNTTRVAYWTYQLLAARIDVGRSTRLGLMPEVFVQNQVYGYAYQWLNGGRNLYLLWSESGTRPVTFSVGTPTVRLTNLITDRLGTILEQREVAAVNGQVSTDIGADPVVIEELPLPSSASAYCFGDGSGTPCPCANHSAPGSGAGCLSSLGTGGLLGASGAANVASDTLLLTGTGMPDAAALYFQGTAQENGGQGTVFGDGLRCAGGSVIRLGTQINSGGTSQYPASGNLPIHVQGSVPAGAVRTYQCWYRNSASFCTSATYNLTNGVAVTWAP